MLTSARNRFEGTVSRVLPGAINDEVIVTLSTGDEVVATITKGSTERLDIRPGREVLVLIKASFVILLADCEDYIFSTRNVFPATVTEVRNGRVATEVDMVTEKGLSLTSTITVVSAERLKLAEGVKISAAVKAPHVILAVKKD
ncbi:MAG: TOBE domain-containing protein [Desulfovibrionaceae bacterium]|nr:TOBE domain-containing protein [Desulfovibrionaceae bacterium]